MTRQTGRTTRAIEEAVAVANSGRAVFLIAANGSEDLRISGLIPKGANVEVRSQNGGLVGFDWRTRTIQGRHPNTVYIIDHFAAEQRRAWVLEEIERLKEEAAALVPLIHRHDLPHKRGKKD